MAQTEANGQTACEDWVRSCWLPTRYGQAFHRESLQISTGVFDCDAVSADGRIVAAISTSCAGAPSGQRGVGQLFLLRTGMGFLLLAGAARAIVVLTQRDLYDQCEKERRRGRMPDGVELVYAELPAELAAQVGANGG